MDDDPAHRLRRREFFSAVTAAALGVAACSGTPAESSDGSLSTQLSPERNVDVPVGFSLGPAILWASDTEVVKTFDVIAGCGAAMVRFDLSWTFAEPRPREFNWSVSDRVVDVATERGLEILAVINNAPHWAALAGHRHTGRPAHPEQYAEFAGAVAERYLSRIIRYEIWNEPNGRMFFEPDPDPTVYAAMLTQAYAVIKGVDENAVVVGGALGATGPGDGVIPPVDFLRSMYANGAGGSFDALSFHPYDYVSPIANGALYEKSPMMQIVEMQKLMADNGDGDKKIWVTEYGAPTSIVSEDKQAELIIDSLQQWPEVSAAGPFFVYTLRDEDSASADAEDRFGTMTDHFVPKRAFTDLTIVLAEGNPEREVAATFRANADPALRRPTTPIFEIADGHGQQFELGTRFSTPTGFLSSPPEVGRVAQRMQVLPINDFRDGYQDFAVPRGMRVFSSDRTGTHVVVGGILAAWVKELGFPTSDEYVPTGDGYSAQSRAVDFERGRIIWSPDSGAVVTRY